MKSSIRKRRIKHRRRQRDTRRMYRKAHCKKRRTKRNKKKRRKTAYRGKKKRSRLSKRGGLRVKISDEWLDQYKKMRHEAELHDRGGGRDCGACVYKFLGLPIDQANELAALAVAHGEGVNMDDIDEKLATLFPGVTFNWEVFDIDKLTIAHPQLGMWVRGVDTLNPIFQTIEKGAVAFALITNNYFGHFVVFGKTTNGTTIYHGYSRWAHLYRI